MAKNRQKWSKMWHGFVHLMSMTWSLKVECSVMAWNDRIKIPLKRVNLFFRFRNSKFRKWPKTVKNVQTWPKMKTFDQSYLIFFRINSECLKTYFKSKKSISKIFSRWKFFSGTLPFSDENGHMVKIFDQNCWFFFQNRFRMFQKHILNRKSWFRKNVPVENFSLGLYRFFRKWPHCENTR